MDKANILNRFFGKFKVAQSQRAKEVKLSMQEAEELGDVITELLGVYYSKVSSVNETINRPKMDNNDITMDGGSFK